MNADKALTVACPWCNAGQGVACIWSGSPGPTHAMRKEVLAKREAAWTNFGRLWSSYEDDETGFKQVMEASGETLVGLLVELEGGKQRLIGHYNSSNGGCGCCSGISDNAIIVRYKRVWRPE